MDHLWSPWRYRYVTKEDTARPACVFCEKQNELTVFTAQHCYGLLNLFPYTNGHMMIAPFEHVSRIEDLPEPAWIEMMRMARLAERNIRAAYRCEGLNLGFNIGSVAGAGIAGHIHLHVLPRWNGDANFMTVIGETRVHPESLEDSLAKLTACDWTLSAL
ncbi:HIT family protein [Bryobacter aggregatus]|uniref:HIT family protein n=1 Tax=Bryobacter aggregatus TaxID=360054 RepID=UPI0004E1705D|nr:HIT domain-containing protein [Bryobacter aggregatus]